jgi:multidrug resistance protein EbrA
LNAYFLLAVSIVSEVFATSMLKAANGFKNLLPALGVIVGYGVAFYVLSLSLKTIPIGMAYAIWSGVATALTALVGMIVYKEKFTRKMLFGFIFIIGGVILLNVDGGQ